MTRQSYFLPAQLLALAVVAQPLSSQSSPTPSTRSDSTSSRGEQSTPRERWSSPFAVSSSGEVRPAEVREVTIIGADPAIVEALERRERRVEALARRGSDRTETEPASPTLASREPPPDPNRPSVYRIQNGDTWYGIATRFGLSPQALERANPEMDPGRLRVGQLIAIPGGAEESPRGVVHRVGIGETLWAIARRYDVSLERIREENDLDEDRLRPGQTLVIPVAGPSSNR